MVGTHGLPVSGKGVPEAKRQRSLATFIVSRNDHGLRIRKVGQCRFIPEAFSPEPEATGTVLLRGDSCPNLDLRYAKNLTSGRIGPDACVAILDGEPSHCRFGKAVVLDNTWKLYEMIERGVAGLADEMRGSRRNV